MQEAPKGVPAEGAEEEIELDETLDDDIFIKEQEEHGEDLTTIIGDVEDEEA